MSWLMIVSVFLGSVVWLVIGSKLHELWFGDDESSWSGAACLVLQGPISWVFSLAISLALLSCVPFLGMRETERRFWEVVDHINNK